jgi:hypothetical protein
MASDVQKKVQALQEKLLPQVYAAYTELQELELDARELHMDAQDKLNQRERDAASTSGPKFDDALAARREEQRVRELKANLANALESCDQLFRSVSNLR